MVFMPQADAENDVGLNKRRYERSSCECYAQVQSLKPQFGSVNHGLSHDISEGGVKVRAFRHIPINSRVVVQLGCPEETDTIKAVGSVVWASQAYTADQWLMGIAFTDVNEAARAKIQKLTSLNSAAPVSIDPEDAPD